MHFDISGFKDSSSVYRIEPVSKGFRIELNFAHLFGCFSLRKVLFESVGLFAEFGTFSDSSCCSLHSDSFFHDLFSFNSVFSLFFLFFKSLFDFANTCKFSVVLFLSFSFLCS